MFLALGSLSSGTARPKHESHNRRLQCQRKPAHSVFARQGRCQTWTWLGPCVSRNKTMEPFPVCVFQGFHLTQYPTWPSCQDVNLCKSQNNANSRMGNYIAQKLRTSTTLQYQTLNSEHALDLVSTIEAPNPCSCVPWLGPCNGETHRRALWVDEWYPTWSCR